MNHDLQESVFSSEKVNVNHPNESISYHKEEVQDFSVGNHRVEVQNVGEMIEWEFVSNHQVEVQNAEEMIECESVSNHQVEVENVGEMIER